MAAILNFRIFAKSGKTQIASISLTVRDRAISSKFLTHRYLRNVLLAIFKKNFKKIEKHKFASISLTR